MIKMSTSCWVKYNFKRNNILPEVVLKKVRTWNWNVFEWNLERRRRRMQLERQSTQETCLYTWAHTTPLWLANQIVSTSAVRAFVQLKWWMNAVSVVRFFSVLKRTNAQLRWRFALVTCDRRAPTNRCVCLSGFDAEQPQEREEARLQLNNTHQRRSLVNFQATDDGQCLSQTSTSHLFISLTFNCQRRFRRKLSSVRETMLKYRNSD